MRNVLAAKIALSFVFLFGIVACVDRQDGGTVKAPALPEAAVIERQQGNEQILFGDLHVHTMFSPDGFITAMPLSGGSGVIAPAAACDFARYCSALDFWSINDHAEGITPQRWSDTKQMIRDCNAVSGDPANPDTVAFLGYEWSQVSTSPSAHYGHKNVIFLETDDDKVPTRAIAAPRDKLNAAPMGRLAQWALALQDFEQRDFYFGIHTYYQEIADAAICAEGVNSRDLPVDCIEVAPTPAELFSKLDDWGVDSLVIPHGNSWGMNTPPLTRFDKQLTPEQHDPSRQKLIELYSGHGNGEEYREWRATSVDDDGNAYCPEPSDGYTPCCWQAGKIIQQRCANEGLADSECELRVFEARQNFVDAGISGHLTVPGQKVTDWLNCGQCDDCFAEPMDHRPTTSVQYAMALSNTKDADPEDPLRFRFGFIGSSDNHGTAPGTGYKELDRKRYVDGLKITSEKMASRMMNDSREPLARSIPLSEMGKVGLNKQRNMERQSSFWLTGGLVAAHSEGRDRRAIWGALNDRNVYATSGDRTLLWFDEISGDTAQPMGSELERGSNPRFRVRASGALEQKPGCPQHALDALGSETLASLCGGECYNPSDTRKGLDRVEVIRIRPQRSEDEAVGSLIEDPWRVFPCAGQSNCEVEFSDPDFAADARDSLYYVRAVQLDSPAINGGGLRCETDSTGQCIAVNPCYGDPRTSDSDDCLSPLGERAWSSPIFVDYRAAPTVQP